MHRYLSKQLFLIFFTTILISINFNSQTLANNIFVDKRKTTQNNSKPNDLFTLGQAIYDIVYKFDDEQAHAKFLQEMGVEKGSVTRVSTEQANKISSILKPISCQAGGSAFNSAIGLASFNKKVGLHFVVGDDSTGMSYINSLKKFTTLEVNEIIISQSPTATVTVIIAPDGERTMFVCVGTSQLLKPSDLDQTAIKNYKILLSEAYLWSDDANNNNAIRKFYQYGKENGSINAFALSNDHLVAQYRTEFLDLLKNIDLVFADDKQIFALFATNNWDIIYSKLSKYNTIFVITCAEKGAYIIYNNNKIYIPAHHIQKIIDTTGAGDQFAAGFLYGYLNNLPLKKCGMIGASTAAYIIQQIGATPQIPFSQNPSLTNLK